MPSVTRKAQADRATRRAEMSQRMLAAVETLLEQGGTFTELSVERIRSEADVSRSTFYVYYEDKGHLLQALTADVTELMIEASRDWWDRIESADYAALEDSIANLIEVYRSHATLIAAIVDTSPYDAGVREAFHGRIAEGQAELAARIRTGQGTDVLRSDLDPERTAAWLAWMVEHGLHQLIRGTNDSESRRLANALSRILWHTLYDSPAPPAKPA